MIKLLLAYDEFSLINLYKTLLSFFYNYSMKISNMRTSMTKNPLSLDRFYRFGNREQSQRLNLKHKPTEKHFLLGKWATKLSEIN